MNEVLKTVLSSGKNWKEREPPPFLKACSAFFCDCHLARSAQQLSYLIAQAHLYPISNACSFIDTNTEVSSAIKSYAILPTSSISSCPTWNPSIYSEWVRNQIQIYKSQKLKLHSLAICTSQWNYSASYSVWLTTKRIKRTSELLPMFIYKERTTPR